MSLNMKSFTQALAKTAAVIGETVSSTVHEVTGPRAMQDYELLEQVGSGGPDLVWKLYAGRPRNKATQMHNPEVCVWVLDKKALTDVRLRIGVSRYILGLLQNSFSWNEIFSMLTGVNRFNGKAFQIFLLAVMMSCKLN